MDNRLLPDKTGDDCRQAPCLIKLFFITIDYFYCTNVTAIIRLGSTIFLVIAALVADPAVLQAQLPQYMLNRVAEQQGLRTADIVNMGLDNDGVMWLASQSHIQRFDGRKRSYYPMAETVLQVFTARNNQIWVLTRNKVFRYHTLKNRFEEVFSDSATAPVLNGIIETPTGRIALLRANLVLGFDSVRNSFNEPLFSLPRGGILKYYTTTQGGDVFIGIRDSVVRLSRDFNRIASWKIPGKIFMKALGNGKLLVSNGRFESLLLDAEAGKIFPLRIKDGANGERDFTVFHAVSFNQGQYLLSTNMGLLVLQPDGKMLSTPSFFYNGEPLQNPLLTGHLYRAADSTVYLCHADGIYTCHPFRQAIFYIKNYGTDKQKLVSSDVRGFAEDEAGNTWMATTRGIGRINFITGKLNWYEPFKSGNPIEYPSIRVLYYKAPWLWIGTSGNGVWMMDTRTGRFKRPSAHQSVANGATVDGFNKTYVWQLTPIDSVGLLVIGGGRSFIIDLVTQTYRRIEKRWAGFNARTALQDADGKLWYGSTRGIWVLDKGLNPTHYLRDSFPDQRVAALCEWKPGFMLAGSKGLFEIGMAGNKLLHFKQVDAIPPERFIYCLVKDKTGMVWAGTDDGLYRYDPVAGKAVLFGREDFVQAQAFNSNAAFLAANGTVFMGGRSGINYFKPEALKISEKPLRPKWYSVAFGNDDSAWLTREGEIELPNSNHDLDVSISVPEYENAFGLKFRYRLGNNDGWIGNANSERIRIQNLKPGHYRLEAQVSRENGAWYPVGRPLLFLIGKPWWQTNGFRILAVSAMAGFIFIIGLFRKNKRAREEVRKTVSYFALSGNDHSGTDDILWDIARNCISRLGFEDCVIYLVDESRNMLVQKAAFGEKSPRGIEISNPIEVPVGSGITGTAAMLGESILVKDTSKDPRYIIDDEVRLSELAVPILYKGKVLGVIDSEHRKKHFFTKQHQQTIEQIAAICSSKISRSMAVEEVKKAKWELDLLNTRINETKFMNLRLQMNPHFLFNTLTSIQYLIVSGQLPKASSYLSVFSVYLRNLLTHAEKTFVKLSEELKMLEDYVKLESLTLDETLETMVETGEEVEPDELLIPFMLLQPFVENAIQHGLINKTGPKKFSIRIEYHENETLCCSIEDNGIGREAAARIKAAKMKAGQHESRGVSIAQQRLELLYGKGGRRGSIQYNDLFENGVPAGTRVIIEIPVYQNDMA